MRKLLKAFGWMLVNFGLWIPLLYTLLGVVLFFVYKFNPFDGSDNAVLYLVGFGLCCLLAVVVAFRKLIVKPIKKLINKHKKDDGTEGKKPEKKSAKKDPEPDKKKADKKEEEPQKAQSDFWDSKIAEPKKPDSGADKKDAEHSKDYAFDEKKADGHDAFADGAALTELEKELRAKAKEETPKIYYSAIEPDTLVHEYHNRFEVFKVIDDRKYLSKIEYKDNEIK